MVRCDAQRRVSVYRWHVMCGHAMMAYAVTRGEMASCGWLGDGVMR